MRSLRDEEGRLVHAWRDGRIGAAGMLDDYASMARAALALFEATGEPGYLKPPPAGARGADLLRRDEGGFFITAATPPTCPARARATRTTARRRPASALSPRSSCASASDRRTALARRGRTPDPRRLRRARGAWGSPLTLMSADMLARGGSVVIDGPLDDPRAPALACGRAQGA